MKENPFMPAHGNGFQGAMQFHQTHFHVMRGDFMPR